MPAGDGLLSPEALEAWKKAAEEMAKTAGPLADAFAGLASGLASSACSTASVGERVMPFDPRGRRIVDVPIRVLGLERPRDEKKEAFVDELKEQGW